MAGPTFNVTLHHLGPKARAAGLQYADEEINGLNSAQLTEILDNMSEVAAKLTIYEPSNPEIRIKTDREMFIVRTRYRRLCFVGREMPLRGEEHSVPYIVATVSGLVEPAAAPPPREYERPSSSPMVTRSTVSSSRRGGFSDSLKIAAMMVVSVCCLGIGIWFLVKPARAMGAKFLYLPPSESNNLLAKSAGEYRTGIQEGDRRLVLTADGTLRLAKYGPAQSILDESIRTVRGASQNGQVGLATSDPYLMIVKDPTTIVLYGMNYKRVAP